MMNSTIKNKFKKILIVIFYLVIWQIISMIFKEEILFVSPFKVLEKTFINLMDIYFYKSVFATVYKILLGFIFGSIFGIILSIISYRFEIFKDFIYLPITILKSIPVVSFVILLLFFVGSYKLSIYISFIMVLPIIYLNVYEGLNNVDKNYLKMADIYRVSLKNKIKYIYFEELNPFLISAFSLSIGLAFKSGLAAEVIALPSYGIGTMLYNSKIYLDTANLFSYTIIAVLVSYLCEKIILKILRRVLGWIF